MTITTDYLVLGCGASAMAFVDVMLRESDATFAIVDRRAAPGGHWNDAYPFVRLHQPSACYGVASRELGHGRKDAEGFNKGLYELASGIEVADYFHQLMRDTFLPSGRVSYLPMCELQSDIADPEAHIVSLLSGERRQVRAKRRNVDATRLQTSIPLTHQRAFGVAEGVACIPPNDLARVAAKHRHFAVLGAGKTAIDSVLWLLANGAPATAITWVLPRDPWLINRANFQPGAEFLDSSLGGLATQYEICATAASLREVCERMQAAGLWLRLDQQVWPTMFHGATVTDIEHAHLTRIPGLVRKGHVRRLEVDQMLFDADAGADAVSVPAGTLYVDCTARALAGNVNDRAPVFSPGLIRLQMVRVYQPTFSAALIGHLEATLADDAVKQRLTAVTPMTDNVRDWAAMMATSMANQVAWTQDRDLATWIARCRLDLFGRAATMTAPANPAMQAIGARMLASTGPAIRNLMRLAAEAG